MTLRTYIVTLTLAQLFTGNINGQTTSPEKFEYSETGINSYVVTKVENKTSSNIYNKTINWVKENYSNPDDVLTMKIENQKIRINGTATNLLLVKKIDFPLEYIVEISIKEGRYKFELVSLKTLEHGYDYKNIPNFKTDSKLTRNFGDSPQKIESYFNDMNNRLRSYISDSKPDDDW